MTTTFGAQRAQYSTDAVLSASPVRLLTLLYDRLLLDLERADHAAGREDWTVFSSNLQHGQAVIAELRSSLKVELWDGADGLLALYNYCTGLIVAANVARKVEGVREAIELLEPLRQAWHEAAGQLTAGSVSIGVNRELGIA